MKKTTIIQIITTIILGIIAFLVPIILPYLFSFAEITLMLTNPIALLSLFASFVFTLLLLVVLVRLDKRVSASAPQSSPSVSIPFIIALIIFFLHLVTLVVFVIMITVMKAQAELPSATTGVVISFVQYIKNFLSVLTTANSVLILANIIRKLDWLKAIDLQA